MFSELYITQKATRLSCARGKPGGREASGCLLTQLTQQAFPGRISTDELKDSDRRTRMEPQSLPKLHRECASATTAFWTESHELLASLEHIKRY